MATNIPTDKQVALLNSMADDLDTTISEIGEELTKINEAIAGKLNPIIERYNSMVVQAQSEIELINSAITEHIEEKGEKWQESDEGSNWADLQSEWEAVSLGEADLVEPLSDVIEPMLSQLDELVGLIGE